MRCLLAAVAAFLPAIGAHVLAAASSALSTPPRPASFSKSNGIPMPPQGIYPFSVNTPLVQMSPTGLGPPSQVWNMTYTNISSLDFYPGMIGLGQAQYTTTLDSSSAIGAASVTFQFVGTGVSFLGSAGFFDVLDWRVDGVSSLPVGSNGLNPDMGFGLSAEVAWARNLEWGLHNCTLIVQNTYQEVMLREVIIQTGIQGATLTDTPTDNKRIQVNAVDSNTPSTALNKTGSWYVFTPPEGDTLTRDSFPQTGYIVLRTNTTGSLSYKVPKNTSYIEVWGSTGWNFSNYSVTLTPPPPFNPPVFNYSASTPYYVSAYTLSWAILDPSVNYTLEYKTYGGPAEVWQIQYFLAEESPVNSTTPMVKASGSGLSGGAIAGVAVGALLGGLAIATLVGLALFRRYQKKQPKREVFQVDNGSDTRPEPFYANPEAQGYGDGELGLNPASNATSPTSPIRSQHTEDASSSGGPSWNSSSNTGPTMHVTNEPLAPATFKTLPATPRPQADQSRRRSSATAPLPITVQERDAGAQVIHIVQYVPPAYDNSLRPANIATAPVDARSTGASTAHGVIVDDPIKPGGVRPLPNTPS